MAPPVNRGLAHMAPLNDIARQFLAQVELLANRTDMPSYAHRKDVLSTFGGSGRDITKRIYLGSSSQFRGNAERLIGDMARNVWGVKPRAPYAAGWRRLSRELVRVMREVFGEHRSAAAIPTGGIVLASTEYNVIGTLADRAGAKVKEQWRVIEQFVPEASTYFASNLEFAFQIRVPEESSLWLCPEPPGPGRVHRCSKQVLLSSNDSSQQSPRYAWDYQIFESYNDSAPAEVIANQENRPELEFVPDEGRGHYHAYLLNFALVVPRDVRDSGRADLFDVDFMICRPKDAILKRAKEEDRSFKIVSMACRSAELTGCLAYAADICAAMQWWDQSGREPRYPAS